MQITDEWPSVHRGAGKDKIEYTFEAKDVPRLHAICQAWENGDANHHCLCFEKWEGSGLHSEEMNLS
jgi:hypothetical protein